MPTLTIALCQQCHHVEKWRMVSYTCSYACFKINSVKEKKNRKKSITTVIFVLFWTTSHSAYFCVVVFHLSPFHTQCRGGEHREGHRRHPLLTFLPLQQPALSVFRTWWRGKRWGRGAEADRKPVSIRSLHHDSAHFTHYWYVMLVHLICPTPNNHRESLTFVRGLDGVL